MPAAGETAPSRAGARRGEIDPAACRWRIDCMRRRTRERGRDGCRHDGTGAGASSSFDAVVYLIGEGNTVYLHFLNAASISNPNVWFPNQKFGRIYMHGSLLPVVIDMLRNEKQVYCLMSDTVPGRCQISTSAEPVGEGANRAHA